MFGRGQSTVEKIEPMKVYPQNELKWIQEWLSDPEKKLRIKLVNIKKLTQISIDKITYRIAYEKKEVKEIISYPHKSANGKYMKAFKKGLGLFIVKDLKKNEEACKKQYAILTFASKEGKKMHAFIRFILPHEVDENGGLEEMKEYGAISGWTDKPIDISDDVKYSEGTYYVVMKVFKASSFTNEESLGYRESIRKESDDPNWIKEMNVFESLPDIDDEEVKASPSKRSMSDDIEPEEPQSYSESLFD